MALEILRNKHVHWRWPLAAAIFFTAMLGLTSGVGLTERPSVMQAGLLTKAYYSLGLFVLGGLDIGTPVGGPLWGRVALWTAYFSAPVLTASALLAAILNAVAPQRWRLRWLRNHIIIVGDGPLTQFYLGRLSELEDPSHAVVLLDITAPSNEQQLEQRFNATVLRGDLSQTYLWRRIKLQRAQRVLLFGESDFASFEAATRILDRYPNLQGRIVLRSHDLRFMRSMADTAMARQIIMFNSYHLAASAMVANDLIPHFQKTRSLDTVVMAGFGRFGQIIIEQLINTAGENLAQIAIIDQDADRRVLIAEEQQKLPSGVQRHILQGDISHPRVWRQLADLIDLSREETTLILGTGMEDHNLRTAVWLKQQYPNALVYARTYDKSVFAERTSKEFGVHNFSITGLIESNLPINWFE